MEHFFARIFSDEEALVASKRPFGKEKDLGWSAGVIISSNQCTLFVYQEECICSFSVSFIHERNVCTCVSVAFMPLRKSGDCTLSLVSGDSGYMYSARLSLSSK